jgi:hypothetical protein
MAKAYVYSIYLDLEVYRKIVIHYFIRWLWIFLFCLSGVAARAQDTTTSIKSSKGSTIAHTSIKKQPDPVLWDHIFKALPLVAVFGALLGIRIQIRARRRDDILKNQLERLNKQISEFYGPLHTLYETGHRNHYNFLVLHGDNASLKNPNYKIWYENIFHSTNSGMENIIINKADLVLGKDIPDCLLAFCKWSAKMKLFLNAPSQDGYDESKSKVIEARTQHPEVRMQMYLRASLEVLKEEQSRLLSGKKTREFSKEEKELIAKEEKEEEEEEEKNFVNEGILIKVIKFRTEKYIADSEDPRTEEKKTWKEIEEYKMKKQLRRL